MSPVDPPAVVQPAPESEADFRKWVRDEFRHMREMLKLNGEALDYLVRAEQAREKAEDAGHD